MDARAARFNGTTEQLAQVLITNFDVEDFLSDRTGLVPRLETAIRDTFRGRNVNAYLHNLLPAGNAPQGSIDARKIG
jgi:hypothetical protein